MRSLSLALVVALTACGPHINIRRIVPPKVMLGPDVKMVTVDAVPPSYLKAYADPMAASRNMMLTPDAVQRIEVALLNSRALSVLRGCPYPCPASQAGILVQVTQSAVTPFVPETKKDFAKANEASVDQTVTVVRPNGQLLYEGNSHGWAQGSTSSPVPDQVVLARAVTNAADTFVAMLSRQEIDELFPLKKNEELKDANQFLIDGNADAAIAAYRQIIAANPANADAHYSLGVALTVKDQLEDARASFAQAEAINPAYRSSRVAAEGRLADRAVLQSIPQ
jgi:tetratricopeptide (TPR) repeat protein